MQAAPPLVLVVEDQSLIALAYTGELLDAGYRVVLTGSPKAAQNAAAAELPAVAVVDLNLRGHLDGVAVAHALRRRGVPLVVTSGHSRGDVPDVEDALKPTAWLVKPFRSEQLLGAVRRAVGPRAAA